MQIRQMLWTFGFFYTLDMYKGALRSPGVLPNLGVDVLGGFFAGASGVALNCWCDVCRSVVQKKALAATFDPAAARPGAFEGLNPGPFFGEAANLIKERGIGGLYAGVGPKMVHLGGSGAILAVLMPRFKKMWFDAQGLE